MRMLLAAGIVLVAGGVTTTPSQAQQGGEYMWCAAWTDNVPDKTYFYSGFFAAGAWEAERRALKFKSVVEKEGVGAATIKATCMPPAGYDAAVATRNAAMKGAPGKVLNWEG